MFFENRDIEVLKELLFSNDNNIQPIVAESFLNNEAIAYKGLLQLIQKDQIRALEESI